MNFIRAKEIPPGSGNWYDYEVKTIHEGKRVIQKVIRYIGKSSRTSMSSGGVTHMGTTPAPVNVSKPARVTKMKTSAKLIASAMGLYYGGMSLDAIQQQFRQDHELDMSESNYWNWVKRFTKKLFGSAEAFTLKSGIRG